MNPSLLHIGKLAFLLLVITACSVTTGCSSSPDGEDGKRVIQNRITNESQGRVKLVSFQKDNGAQGEMNGFETYRLEFTTEIEFTEDCKWLAGPLASPMSFKTIPPQNNSVADLMNPGQSQKRGERLRLTGWMIFVKKEKGWDMDTMEIDRVSPADALNPNPTTDQNAPTSAANDRTSVIRAQSEIAEIVKAIQSYKTTYGLYPNERNLGTNDFTYSGRGLENILPSNSPNTNNSEIIAILMDIEKYPDGAKTINFGHAENSQQIKFLNARMVSDTVSPGVGQDLVYRDPWGDPYIISMDLDYDGYTQDALYKYQNVSQQTAYNASGYNGLVNRSNSSGASDNYEYHGDVMVWSLGPDKGASINSPASGNDAGHGINKDNVLSWKVSKAQEQIQNSISPQSSEIACVNNMKQIGLSFRVWAGDHDNKFPFNVSTNGGSGWLGRFGPGTMELCDRGPDGFDRSSFRILQVMSNELSTPEVLVCPGDTTKTIALDFGNLQPKNVTYEVRSGAGLGESTPNEILIRCPIHGTVGLCDGSVRRVSK